MTARPSLSPAGYVHDGRVYPRVTQVLGVLAKPSLEAWRLRVGAGEAERISSMARELGTRVHAALEMINRGVPPPNGELTPFVQIYRQWFAREVTGVIAVEQFVLHDVDIYAGTLDLVARLRRDGLLYLIDLKTSNSSDMTHRLQTAAYVDAWHAMGRERIAGRLIVRLPSREPGVLYEHTLDEFAKDRLAWRAALRLWRWAGRHKHAWRDPGVRYG